MPKEEKFTGELKQPKKTGKTIKKFAVTFRGSRKFELYVGRKYFVFNGRQTVELTESEIKHPDFIQQEKYFTVKGV